MSKKITFGLGIPTGTEGLMYPIPYASARDVVDISVHAEKMGFDSVWGNDHISTQHYVREEFDKPPRYYSPLLMLAAIAERTTKLKIATALLVLPFRNPVVVAKELATLDNLSNGRLLLGVGIGAYREEFEAEFGAQAKGMMRGEMLDESVDIINRIFTEDNVNFEGKYFSCKDVQSYPKPIQKPFPFYFGGNSDNGVERAAKYATGWLPALLTPQEIKDAREKMAQFCEKYGTDPKKIDIAPQLSIAVAKTREEAYKRFEKSQIYRHAISLSKSTMQGKDATKYKERNLVGSVEDVLEQIQQYVDVGVTTFSALIFANNTIAETKEEMEFFSKEIIARL